MKLHSTAIASLALASILFCSTQPAAAATVDFTWDETAAHQGVMTPLEIGQSGNITVTVEPYVPTVQLVEFQIYGTLPENSVMTLSYSMEPLTPYSGSGAVVNRISYEVDYYTAYANMSSETGWTFEGGSASPLVKSTTEVAAPGVLTAIFENLSGYNASFGSSILGYANLPQGELWHLTGHYSVASAVPLPAALPLFGAGVMALAAQAARRRKVGQNTVA